MAFAKAVSRYLSNVIYGTDTEWQLVDTSATETCPVSPVYALRVHTSYCRPRTACTSKHIDIPSMIIDEQRAMGMLILLELLRPMRGKNPKGMQEGAYSVVVCLN